MIQIYGFMTQVLTTPNNISEEIKNGILVIGNFDGLHKGHECLLSYAKKLAVQHTSKVIVWIYVPQPRLYLNNNNPKMLMNDNQRIQALKNCKISTIIAYKYHQETVNELYDTFTSRIIEPLSPQYLLAGNNTNINKLFLNEQSKKHKFDLEFLKLHCTNNAITSSTRIRQLIQQNQIQVANNMLVSPWSIWVSDTSNHPNKKHTIAEIDEKYVLPPNDSYHKAAIIAAKNSQIPMEVYIKNNKLCFNTRILPVAPPFLLTFQ